MSTRRTTLVLVLVAVFMLLLDISVVTVALPQHPVGPGGLVPCVAMSPRRLRPRLGDAAASGRLPHGSSRVQAGISGRTLVVHSRIGCMRPRAVDSRAQHRPGRSGRRWRARLAAALPLIGAAYPRPRERSGLVAAFGATVAVAIAIGPLVGGAVDRGVRLGGDLPHQPPGGPGRSRYGVAPLGRLGQLVGGAAPRSVGMGLLGLGLFALVFATVRGNVMRAGVLPPSSEALRWRSCCSPAFSSSSVVGKPRWST